MPRLCALLSAAALLACAAASADRAAPPARQAAAAVNRAAGKRTVTAGGVRLTFDSALAPEVRAVVSPASPLESPTDKPDWFWPERAVFDLSAAYPAPAAGRAEIQVCSVEDFKRAAAVSGEVSRRVGLTVRDLRLLLRRRPAAPAGAIPTLPFPDAHDAFRARLKYLRFKGGAGVAYLTQSQQDEGLVNNEQLTYEFRGLTDDGRHYVYASLPAAAPSLPPTRDAASHDGYPLPRTFDGPGRAAKLRAYRNYVARVKRRLERLPPDAFTPSLRLLDETLSSVEVNK
ncbi:MAG TPA: hypothetical protein VG148_13190 [Pyrinomonadaceae bacterium]|nr:hypothetical protein [Pyrinomonadaceae bacterium]